MCLRKEIRIALLLALTLGILSTGHAIPAPVIDSTAVDTSPD